MGRIKTLLSVAVLIPAALAIAAYTNRAPALTAAPAPRPTAANAFQAPASVNVTLRFGELDALPEDAQLSVRLVEVSKVDGTENVLGESLVSCSEGSFPHELQIGFDPAMVNPSGQYVVGAEIMAGGELVYWTATRSSVIADGYPTRVELVLTEAGPATYAGQALSSGRLAPSTY